MKLVLVLFVLLLSSFCEFTKAVCLKISPTRLVVKYGDPASANCTPDTPQTLAWEATQGGVSLTSDKVQFLEWTVNSVTDWTIAPICYTDGGVCAETLNITVYELPSMVSISGPSDRMVAGRQSEFRCGIQDVFPVNRLHVSFYKVSINNIKTEITSYPPEMNIPNKPSSKEYTLQFTPSRGDHGAQLWCSARLELGEERPKPPPEMESQHLPLNVYCSGKATRSVLVAVLLLQPIHWL
ncbi:hypothetical protein DPEC_G00168930 [Dallia pectoralis]|uniref:Uncharacterized protein n=1 Tax=Dallia pectoralis TaxID=75939 RepID=A0ACC2GCJ0_DALPE|nr:hypothetical protein DPEC_G00168930 [Dallia pectoralis]